MKFTPLAFIAGIVLVVLIGFATIPGSTTGLGDYLKGKPLYDVRCDVTVQNLPVLDARITGSSCQSTFSTTASCLAPFSVSSWLGLSDELNLQGELAGKIARKEIEVKEGTVIGEDFSLNFKCVPEGTYKGRFSIFTLQGNFVDQKDVQVKIP